ncbi:MAG: IclR family transcriptional regulator [Acidobacteria bacterium]|nr:IclR family transcriptional regulator [Acidobacteriota bacterium]MBV9144301.1 IclR family transcriptional regulator [Acidobacteriota bacterium]MBV9435897.1 IclR family transcriptional regulator [Acidobacteriota bacterium]
MIRSRESKSAPVGVVTKVLRILEALHAAPAGLQLKDVAQQTGINKSTAYRFLAHLEHEGYVFRDSSGAYAIGVRLARLASGASYQTTLRKLSRPILQQLWRTTGETVNLGVLDGREVLYMDVMESSHTFRLVSQVGLRRPVYCTALGKAMLAYIPEEELPYFFSGLTFERFTPHTLKSVTQLRKDIAAIQQRGYSIDNEEAYLGSRCVAAPIFDSMGKIAAALSVSGPTTRVTREQVPLFGRAAKNAAAAISRTLGYALPEKLEARGQIVAMAAAR